MDVDLWSHNNNKHKNVLDQIMDVFKLQEGLWSIQIILDDYFHAKNARDLNVKLFIKRPSHLEEYQVSLDWFNVTQGVDKKSSFQFPKKLNHEQLRNLLSGKDNNAPHLSTYMPKVPSEYFLFLNNVFSSSSEVASKLRFVPITLGSVISSAKSHRVITKIEDIISKFNLDSSNQDYMLAQLMSGVKLPGLTRRKKKSDVSQVFAPKISKKS